MINKETQERLSKLGFDVSKMADAFKSDQEVGFEVPSLLTQSDVGNYLNEEQKKEFGENSFQNGYQQSKKVMGEIFAKNIKAEYGLEVEGKDLNKVVQSVFDKGAKSGANPELANNFNSLQKKYTELEQKREADLNEYRNRLAISNIKHQLLGSIPSDQKTKIGRNDLVDLYTLKNKIQTNDNGGAVIIDNTGEVLKDNLLNPVNPVKHFTSWIDQNGYIEKSGMNGSDSKGGGSSSAFKNDKEAYDYMVANGINPMSDKGLKIMTNLKVE